MVKNSVYFIHNKCFRVIRSVYLLHCEQQKCCCKTMLVISCVSIILNAALILGCGHDTQRGKSSNPRIMGGSDMEAKDAPYTVVVQTDRENATFCGGTLTSVRGLQFVISARHCFDSDTSYTEVWVGDRENPIKKS